MLLAQDIVVLLKLALHNDKEAVAVAALAADLQMSPSQAHQALQRAQQGHLVVLGEARGRSRQEKRVNHQALLEVVLHGVRYIYPAVTGGETRGVPSFGQFAPTSFEPHLQPVWPHPEGRTRGLLFEPLAPFVPAAALKDPELHRALAAVDAIRGGQARERRWGAEQLSRMIRRR